MITLVAIPALAVGLIMFFIGYSLKDVAAANAYNEAFKAAVGQITDATKKVTEAQIQALAAKDQADLASKQAKKLSEQLEELLSQQKRNFETISIQVTKELLGKPEFVNSLVRTDKLYRIESSLSTTTPLSLDVYKSVANSGTNVQIFGPTPPEPGQKCTHAQAWRLVEQSQR